MLAYGGHFLTKSRRYSVTFGQLRAARSDHRRATRPAEPGRDAWDRPLDKTVVLVIGTTWSYAGIGDATPGAELAAASAARARERRPKPIMPPSHPLTEGGALPVMLAADDRLWTVEDLSAYLGIPVQTLYRWRRYRCGPPSHRVGRHLRYLPAEVVAWLREQP